MFVTVDRKPKFKLHWATPLLLVVMLSVGIAEALMLPQQKLQFIRAFGLVPNEVRELLQFETGHWFKIVTPLFVHIDGAHLLGNALFLLVFGIAVERVFHSHLVILVFLLCGISSNVATAVMFSHQNAAIVGASGAVSGLIGAYLYLFPSAKLGIVLPLGLYFHAERVPAPLVIGFWFLLQVLYTVSSPNTSTVAWITHILGFVAGFLLAVLFRPLLYSNARRRTLR
jgi:membrane associated rhomboid family serine protease